MVFCWILFCILFLSFYSISLFFCKREEKKILYFAKENFLFMFSIYLISKEFIVAKCVEFAMLVFFHTFRKHRMYCWSFVFHLLGCFFCFSLSGIFFRELDKLIWMKKWGMGRIFRRTHPENHAIINVDDHLTLVKFSLFINHSFDNYWNVKTIIKYLRSGKYNGAWQT